MTFTFPPARYLPSKTASFRLGLRWVFACALIPCILIGLGLGYAIYLSERQAVEQSSRQTARALLSAVDAELIKVQSMAMLLSKSQSLADQDLAAFYRQVQAVKQVTGVPYTFVLSDTQGHQLLNTAKPFGTELPLHGNLALLRQVTETRQPVISNLYTGAVLNRPLISIDVPVPQGNRVVYVLSIGVLPDHFNPLLAEQQLPDGWLATLMDANDIVVARNINPEKMTGRQATPDLRHAIASQHGGTLASRSLEGHPTFIAFEQSHHTRWTVAVGAAQNVLYQSLYRLLTLVALSCLVFMGTGVACAWVFSGVVRRSLEALGSAANAAAAGARHVRVPAHCGIREIDRLAEQFNAMREAQGRAEKKILEMAFYDPLTSLANRRLLMDRLAQAMANSKRIGSRCALMFLDMDNFKSLNDTEGHAVGDLLLIEVAGRLTRCVREMDTVARFGGDEFVVLISGLNSDAAAAQAMAAAVAEKIRLELSEPYRLTIEVEDQPARVVQHHCTVSVGVHVFFGQECNADEILELADGAMYRAKGAGRNVVCFSDLTGRQ